MPRQTTAHRTIALHLMPSRHRRPVRWRPWLKWGGIIFGALVLILGVFTLYYYPKAHRVITDARRVQRTGKTLSQQITQQKFTESETTLAQLKLQISQTSDDLHQMAGLKYWPYLGRQYQAGDALINVGSDGADAVKPLITFLEHLFAPFAGQGRISLSSISAEDKGKLLAGISGQEDSLRQAQTAIHRAADDLDRIPTKGLLPQLARVIVPLKQQFPSLTQALDQAIPATHLIPPILGYPHAKTYLFLLENNTELRPGGGFIGTYGLMKVSSGEIVSLQTDNSYNLDEAAKKLPVIAPPEPLQHYLKAHAWYFRDANWSPDFPSSAKQALTLYQREGGSRNVDGVLAVTPTMISQLLRLVGPISVGKVQFTADNFTDKLQYYVDQGYAYAGQDLSERKDIVGVLTTELVKRLLALPVTQWKDVFLIVSQQLQQKQMLWYMNDTTTQSLLVEQNWAGAMTPTTGADYVLVADANLASLKTDPTVYRTYQYQVSVPAHGQAEATLTIHYDHRGKFDWKTTRYNTYVRVYVPNGSQLIDSHGAQIRQQSNRSGPVNTSNELGLTVFGAFKSIEPGTTSDLILHYRLPDDVTQQIQSHHYRIDIQKEAGVINAQLRLNVTTSGQRPQSVDGLDKQAQLSQDAVSYVGAFETDRSIVINY